MDEIHIPNYTIEKELGRGGMATVYLAVQDMLSRNVALKVMLPEMTRDPNFRNSFLSEGKIIANLEHPNIVRIHDFGIIDDTVLYMAMEHLPNGTLREKINQGKLPYDEAVKIIEDTSAGLAYAHQKGYIHRDIKPGNILFRDDGTAVITDFGIAKLQDTSGELTRMGYTMGTVQYMSPEQAVTTDLDHRSDTYSLGLVFYEMLTGQKAFKAESTIQAIHQHTTVAPPQLPLEYAHLQAVLDKVLAKEPEDRYQNVMAFVDAIHQAKPNNLSRNSHSSNRDFESEKTVIHRTPQALPDDKTQILRPSSNTQSPTPTAPKKSKKGTPWLGILSAAALIGGVAFGVNEFALKQDPSSQQTNAKQSITKTDDASKSAVNNTADANKQSAQQLASAQKQAEEEEKRKQEEARKEQAEKERNEAKQNAEKREELRKEEERKAKQRILAEQIEKAQKQAAEAKKQAQEAEKQRLLAEQQRKEKEKIKQQEKAKKDAELASAKAEQERLAKEQALKAEQERLAAEQKLKAEQAAQQKQEEERLAEEQQKEQERIAKLEAERRKEAEKQKEAERQREQERLAKQKAQQRAEQKKKEQQAQARRKKEQEAKKRRELAKKKAAEEKRRQAALLAKRQAEQRRRQQLANAKGQIRVSATLNGRPLNTTFVVTKNGQQVQTISGRASANFVLPPGRYVVSTQFSGAVSRANVILEPNDIVTQGFAFRGSAPQAPGNWTHQHN